MGNMSKHLGPIALSAAMLGLVAGGVYAGSQAFAPVEQKPQVQLVQPAAQTVTVEPTVTPSPTTTTVAPKPVAKVAPKVESTPKVATTSEAPAPVQEAVVPKSEPAPETTTSQTQVEPAPGPRGNHPLPTGVTTGGTGVNPTPPAPSSND